MELCSGFAALRNECGMNLHRPVRAIALSDDARANIARVQEIWGDCRKRYGGPFLFGAFGAGRSPCSLQPSRSHRRTFAADRASLTEFLAMKRRRR